MKKTLLSLVAVFLVGVAFGQNDGKATAKKAVTPAQSSTTKAPALTKAQQADQKLRLEAKKQHFEALKAKKAASQNSAAAESVN